MVSVCAGCNAYYPWVAIIISIVAGVFYVFASKAIVNMKIDDPLDAVAVHLVSGLWGILAAPIFMDTGILFGGGEAAMRMLAWNALAAGAFIVWYGLGGILIFGLLMALKLFRVNEAHEIQGLDVIKHNEPAYPIGKFDFFKLISNSCSCQMLI